MHEREIYLRIIIIFFIENINFLYKFYTDGINFIILMRRHVIDSFSYVGQQAPSFYYSCNWYQNYEFFFLESSSTSIFFST